MTKAKGESHTSLTKNSIDDRKKKNNVLQISPKLKPENGLEISEEEYQEYRQWREEKNLVQHFEKCYQSILQSNTVGCGLGDTNEDRIEQDKPSYDDLLLFSRLIAKMGITKLKSGREFNEWCSDAVFGLSFHLFGVTDETDSSELP